MGQEDRHKMNEFTQSRYTNFLTSFLKMIINLKHQSKQCFSILAGGNTKQYWRLALTYFRFVPFSLSFVLLVSKHSFYIYPAVPGIFSK